MSTPLSKIRDKYVETLVDWIPIPLAAIYLIFLLTLFATEATPSHGIFFALSNLTLTQIFASSKGLLWEASIFQLLASVAMTMVVMRLHRMAKLDFFTAITKIKPVDVYVENLRKIQRGINADKAGKSQIITTATNPQPPLLNNRKIELQRRNGVSEIFLALSLIPILFFRHASISDFAISITCLLGVVILHWNMYIFYLSKFLPTLIMHDPNHEFGDGLIDEHKVP